MNVVCTYYDIENNSVIHPITPSTCTFKDTERLNSELGEEKKDATRKYTSALSNNIKGSSSFFSSSSFLPKDIERKHDDDTISFLGDQPNHRLNILLKYTKMCCNCKLLLCLLRRSVTISTRAESEKERRNGRQ